MRFDPFTALDLALAAVLCLFGPIVLGILWRQRTGVARAPFGWGMVVFAGTMVLRLWQFPLGRWIYRDHPSWTVWFVLLSACTAGVFEEVGRWIGYRKVLRGERSQRVGVMYGLGHGGCESMLLVSLPMVALLIGGILASHGHINSAPVVNAIRQQIEGLGAWGVPLAVFERASAMALHVGLSLIVLQALTHTDRPWLLIAIVIHVVVDAAAVLLNRHLLTAYTAPIIAVAAVAVLYAGLRLSGAPAARLAPAPAPAQ